jgi:hypothetical protein
MYWLIDYLTCKKKRKDKYPTTKKQCIKKISAHLCGSKILLSVLPIRHLGHSLPEADLVIVGIAIQ